MGFRPCVYLVVPYLVNMPESKNEVSASKKIEIANSLINNDPEFFFRESNEFYIFSITIWMAVIAFMFPLSLQIIRALAASYVLGSPAFVFTYFNAFVFFAGIIIAGVFILTVYVLTNALKAFFYERDTELMSNDCADCEFSSFYDTEAIAHKIQFPSHRLDKRLVLVELDRAKIVLSPIGGFIRKMRKLMRMEVASDSGLPCYVIKTSEKHRIYPFDKIRFYLQIGLRLAVGEFILYILALLAHLPQVLYDGFAVALLFLTLYWSNIKALSRRLKRTEKGTQIRLVIINPEPEKRFDRIAVKALSVGCDYWKEVKKSEKFSPLLTHMGECYIVSSIILNYRYELIEVN